MSDDIFAGNDQDSAPNTPDVTADQLVGDDKKYKTIDELAKAKLHADAFINQLKDELQGMREDLNARVKLQEVVDRLTSRNQHNDDDDELPSFDSNNDENLPSGQPGTITQAQLNDLVTQQITKLERERTANQNKANAIDELRKRFGSDYLDRLKARQEQLGLSKEDMNALAAQSPTAFLELVAPQTTQTERPFTPPTSSVRTDSSPQGGAQPGSAEYYQKLKKDNPSLYWTPKVQNQLHKDAIKAAKEDRPFKI